MKGANCEISNIERSPSENVLTFKWIGNDGSEQTDSITILNGSSSTNNITCKLIAHRGFHVHSYQNTISAFKEAIDDGFKYLEIDIRKTADGTYVLSHDDIITLYDNGMRVSVTISSANYQSIKHYTWDVNGTYPLNTLHSAFNATKIYDVCLICDLKNGSNSEILEIANLCGVTDRLILSYGSILEAISNTDLLKRYSHIPIRIIPSDYTLFSDLAGRICNPIYADVNASMSIHRSNYLNYAFTIGLPILFAGCTASNANVWAQVASGCMSNDDDNISYDAFKDLITGDYDTTSDLTVSKESIDIDLNETISIEANNTHEDVSCNIYAYSKDPTIAEVTQNTFGNSVSVTIKAKSIGETTIIVFDGNGGNIRIPITVSDIIESGPTLGIQNNVEIIKGCSINGNDLKGYKNSSRMMGVSTVGSYPLREGDNLWLDNRYALEIPDDATSIVITCDGYIPGLMIMDYDAETSYYKPVADSGWLTANSATYSLSSGGKYVVINFKNLSNTAIDSTADTSGIIVEFV